MFEENEDVEIRIAFAGHPNNQEELRKIGEEVHDFQKKLDKKPLKIKYEAGSVAGLEPTGAASRSPAGNIPGGPSRGRSFSGGGSRAGGSPYSRGTIGSGRSQQASRSAASAFGVPPAPPPVGAMSNRDFLRGVGQGNAGSGSAVNLAENAAVPFEGVVTAEKLKKALEEAHQRLLKIAKTQEQINAAGLLKHEEGDSIDDMINKVNALNDVAGAAQQKAAQLFLKETNLKNELLDAVAKKRAEMAKDEGAQIKSAAKLHKEKMKERRKELDEARKHRNQQNKDYDDALAEINKKQMGAITEIADTTIDAYDRQAKAAEHYGQQARQALSGIGQHAMRTGESLGRVARGLAFLNVGKSKDLEKAIQMLSKVQGYVDTIMGTVDAVKNAYGVFKSITTFFSANAKALAADAAAAKIATKNSAELTIAMNAETLSANRAAIANQMLARSRASGGNARGRHMGRRQRRGGLAGDIAGDMAGEAAGEVAERGARRLGRRVSVFGRRMIGRRGRRMVGRVTGRMAGRAAGGAAGRAAGRGIAGGAARLLGGTLLSGGGASLLGGGGGAAGGGVAAAAGGIGAVAAPVAAAAAAIAAWGSVVYMATETIKGNAQAHDSLTFKIATMEMKLIGWVNGLVGIDMFGDLKTKRMEEQAKLFATEMEFRHAMHDLEETAALKLGNMRRQMAERQMNSRERVNAFQTRHMDEDKREGLAFSRARFDNERLLGAAQDNQANIQERLSTPGLSEGMEATLREELTRATEEVMRLEERRRDIIMQHVEAQEAHMQKERELLDRKIEQEQIALENAKKIAEAQSKIVDDIRKSFGKLTGEDQRNAIQAVKRARENGGFQSDRDRELASNIQSEEVDQLMKQTDERAADRVGLDRFMQGEIQREGEANLDVQHRQRNLSEAEKKKELHLKEEVQIKLDMEQWEERVQHWSNQISQQFETLVGNFETSTQQSVDTASARAMEDYRKKTAQIKEEQ